MDEAELEALSYRDAQKRCKELGLSAKGKQSELLDRLRSVGQGIRDDELPPVSSPSFADHRTPLEPVTPRAFKRDEALSTKSPNSEARTRAIARSAMAAANSTPLPEPPGAMTAPPASFTELESTPAQTPPAKRRRASFAEPAAAEFRPAKKPKQASASHTSLLFATLFLLTSALLAGLAAYSLRVDWAPVLESARSDLPSAIRELSSQARDLYRHDAQTAAHRVLHARHALGDKQRVLWQQAEATLKHATRASRHFMADVPGGMASLCDSMAQRAQRLLHRVPHGDGNDDAACQAGPQGLRIAQSAAFATFYVGDDVALSAVDRFVANAARREGRRKAVAHVVAFDAEGTSASDAAAAISEGLGCSGPLQGQCREIDAAAVIADPSGAAAALQAAVGPQLQAQPDSLFILTHADRLTQPGAAILLQLIGENGMINQPGCDVATPSATVLLLAPDTQAGALESFEAALRESVADGAGLATAKAVRRRLSESVLRLVGPSDDGAAYAEVAGDDPEHSAEL